MAEQQAEHEVEQDRPSGDDQGRVGLDRSDESQDFVDQSKIDFDPDEGLYSGTAVQGDSEIPGPHLDADSGELTGMDEVRKQAEDAGIDPSDTPAAKSPVARAHEAKTNSAKGDESTAGDSTAGDSPGDAASPEGDERA